MTTNVNNAYVLDDEVCSVPLDKGLYALIDRCDFEKISQHKWHAKRGKNTWYAQRTLNNGKKVLMHHEILGKKEGFETDHRNGNGLDNRRRNIRFATHTQNLRNQKRTKGIASRYKGVRLYKRTGRWQARIRINGKLVHLGYFNTDIEAARAYDRAAINYYGEFANINLDYPQELDGNQTNDKREEKSQEN